MPDVAFVEVDFPGLGKVEVFGPGVAIVDDEFYFTPDPIATSLVLSTVVDVFTGDCCRTIALLRIFSRSVTSSTVAPLL